MTKPQMPEWARSPDPSFVDKLERLRRRHAWGFDQRPLLLNEGSPYQEPFTLEMALPYFELLAADVLT